MRTFQQLIIGLWFVVSSMGQDRVVNVNYHGVRPLSAATTNRQDTVVNLIYKRGTIIDSLNYSAATIGTCELRKTTVKGQADFSATTFSKWANFTDITILRAADFQESTFADYASFLHATFLHEADFDNTTFSDQAEFSEATFSKRANFDNTTFSKAADFSSITSSDLDFRKANFSESANFFRIEISNKAVFLETTFSKQANFTFASFSKAAVFNGSAFLEPPDFRYMQLPDSLYFESVNLQNLKTSIFLSLARLDRLRKNTGDTTRICTILLYHTDVSKLVLDHEKFRLGFGKNVNLEEKISTYQQVIKKCRDIGMEASAQGFDIDLQKMKLQDRWGVMAPVFIGFQQYWWNFGHDRSMIILNTVYAFLVSFVIFLIGYRRFFVAYFPSEQLGLRADNVFMPVFNRSWAPSTVRSKALEFTDRTKITFFYTALIFFGWKMDHAKLNYRTYPWTALWVYLIYIIGLIHLAYLAGFVIAR